MAQSVSIKSRLAGYNWVTGAAFTLSIILMEIFWVFPWLIWFSQIPDFHFRKPPLSLISLILILGISFVSSRYFINRDWSLHRVRLSIIACSIFTIFAVIRFEYSAYLEILNGEWFAYIARLLINSFSRLEPLIVALFVSVCLSLRGIRLGRSYLEANDIYRNFLIGVASLIVLILISGAATWTRFDFDMSSVWIYLAGFFFFGLLAMALANLKSVQQKVSAETVTPALNRRWFSVLLVVIGGMVTIGIMIAGTISTDFSYFLTRMLKNVSDFFAQILYYIYIPFGYVIEWLYQTLSRLINIVFGENREPMEMTDIDFLKDAPENTAVGLPPEVILMLKWAFFVIIAGLVIYLLSKAIFRYKSNKDKDDLDEVHESLLSWDLFKSDFQLMLDKLRGLALLRKRRSAAISLPEWYSDDFQGILSVRQIYECLLWETSRRNLGRYQYETPIEYAGRLYRKVPESREMLNEITDLYVDARYGEHEIKSGILEYANYKWKSLRKLLRGHENGQI